MLVITLVSAFSLSAFPPTPDTLTITLAHDSEAERATARQVRELYARHDFRDWVVTDKILIDEEEIPHSHPVLTLHARHLHEPDNLLSTFLHEEFHWWVDGRREALDSSITEFREIWPDVPSSQDGGARDEYSTYLHLVVCDLELQATSLLVGEPAAREALERLDHYGWIYKRVLGDSRVREVMRTHGFILR
jgi:hypothetical protein